MSVSTKINDGGPAFPVPDNAESSGVTMRDWFAGQALATLVVEAGKRDAIGYPMPSMEYIAARAYAFADAMIAARSKP